MLAVVLVAGCGTSLPTASPAGKVRIVAAENFWGSIASQVGGEHASVTSIVANPNADPHDYEATPGDARAVATAKYVIANGAGYDPWVQRLVDANPVSGRKLLVVADLVGAKAGDNPHLWYSPADVQLFVNQVATDLGSLESADAEYFATRAQTYLTADLNAYHAVMTVIKQKYAGTKVGATESIFVYMAAALGLNLVTPAGYMKSISEGQDPSAADKAEVERQLATKEVKVFVVNAQNSTPDVQGLVAKARANGIAVTTITETLTPSGATFQDWQAHQLQDLLRSLGG